MMQSVAVLTAFNLDVSIRPGRHRAGVAKLADARDLKENRRNLIPTSI
jgi:hypothetical protein